MTGHWYWFDSDTVGDRTTNRSPRNRLPTGGNGSYELDADFRFVAVSDPFVELTGYDSETLLGAHASIVLSDAAVETAEALVEAPAERSATGASADRDRSHGRRNRVVVTIDAPVRSADGETIPCTHRLQRQERVDESDGRIVATVRTDALETPDATGVQETGAADRGDPRADERAANAESTRGDGATTASAGDSAAVLADRDDRSPVLSEAVDRIADGFYVLDADLEYAYVNDRARALLGDPRDGDFDRRAFEPPLFSAAHERALNRQRRLTVETYHPPADAWLEARIFPSETGLTGCVREITERTEREKENRLLRSIFEDVHDAILFGDENEIVAANPAACELLGIDRTALRGRSLTEFVHDSHDVESAWDSFVADGRYRGSFSLIRPDGSERIVDCNAVADVLPGVHVSVLRDTTEARNRERQLERQRERLTALDHVYGVARDLNDAIVTGSTREELERVTCESLADAPSYLFAFVAAVDPSEGTVFHRAEAGIDGYLESIPLSIDADAPAGQGPLGRAVRTQEIQVSNDVFADPDFEPWHEDAREHGYRSAAAVPVTHDGALYGVLGITSEREYAFTDEERAAIGQLGEILGHAIAGLERTQVLLGETVIELELVIDDAVSIFDGPDMDGQSVWLDRVIRIGDDRYLEYGTTAAETLPDIEELVECVPHWDAITVLDRAGDEVRFELTIASPPLFSVVESHGGYVESAAIHDGDYITTLHFSQDTDVRAVTDAIKEIYPSVQIIARRQITPVNESIGQLQSHLARKLTDRQQTALETAYYAGFFEWPRDSSGEEIAAALGISPATFHEHLRTAQQKLIETIVNGPDTLHGGPPDD
ncbi:bacterio-opsin activator domain-containing protein [Halosolutus gelatinilyticus]|uniref:bacterio-opsin activator domain-containing protein n=1 Tax=Halosolutus gelatinilyticus TaxID=2931975 RepID=UPI001FF45CA5|nr:bacterio-opsin activator domain-containing protein [Halosolutus gelatinilyticus]